MSNNIPKATGEINSTDLLPAQHLLRKRHSPGSTASSSKKEETVGSSGIAVFSKLRKISNSDLKTGIFGQQGGGSEDAEKPGPSNSAVSSPLSSVAVGKSGRRNSQLKYLTDYFPNQSSSEEFRLTRSRSKAKQNVSLESPGFSHHSSIPISKEKYVKRHSSHHSSIADGGHYSTINYGKQSENLNQHELASMNCGVGANFLDTNFVRQNSSIATPSSSTNMNFAGNEPAVHFDLNAITSSVIMNISSSTTIPQQQSAIQQPAGVSSNFLVLGAPGFSKIPNNSDGTLAGQLLSVHHLDTNNHQHHLSASSSSSTHALVPPSIGINRSALTGNNNYSINNSSKPTSSMFGLRSHQHVNRATTFLGSLVPRMQHLLGNSTTSASNVVLGDFDSGTNNGMHFHHSSSRVVSIVDGLRSTNEIRQSEAASELAEMLLLGNEESLPNMPVRDIIQCLMALLQKDHNFELMLTAARCITNMQEALPRALPLITEAIPLLLQKLKRIEYIDVAEQSLIALEVMSRRNARNILTAGGIAATISHVDFFSLPSQRLAFQISANCAVYLTAAEFSLVKDCLSDLTQRLTYVDDKRCVESICIFFNRVIENVRIYSDKLREIAGANFDFLKGVQQLLMIQPSTLSSNTFLSLLKSLRYMCSKCGDIAIALVNQDFGRTLRYLLVGQEKYDEVSFDIGLRPPQQVKELIELIGELMPNLPNTEVSEIMGLLDQYMNIGGLYSGQNILRTQHSFDVLAVNWYVMNDENGEWQLLGAEETTLLENAKANGEQLAVLELEDGIYEVDFIRMVRRNTNTEVECNLDRRLTSVNNSLRNRSFNMASRHYEDDERNVLKQTNSKNFLELIGLLCPILVEIGTNSTCSGLRFETLKVMVRMVYAVESETQLRKILADVPLAIYIASTLSSNKNIGVLVSAIQLVHILLEKIPHLYVPLLDAEGVFHEIEKISKAKKKSDLISDGHSKSLSTRNSAFKARSGRTPQGLSGSSTSASSSSILPTNAPVNNSSELSISSYLAAAAAMVSATAPNSNGLTAPLNNAAIVNQYTQHFGHFQQQMQRQQQQQQFQTNSTGYNQHQLRSHSHASASGSLSNNNMLASELAASNLQQIFQRQQQPQNLNELSLHGAPHIHHQHHQHVLEQQQRQNNSTAISFTFDRQNSLALINQQQRQLLLQQQQAQRQNHSLSSSSALQQQQLHNQVVQAAAAAAAQNILNSSIATGTTISSTTPSSASIIPTCAGAASNSLTASEVLLARAHAAFPAVFSSSVGTPSSSSLSSQQLEINNVQTLTNTGSLSHSMSSPQSTLKQGILDRLQKYIQSEATKILIKCTGEKSTKFGIRNSSNNVLNQLSKISKQLSTQGRDVGCEPLNALSRILVESEISAFQLNHSGIISALNAYLTNVSEKMFPPLKLRLRRFVAVFMKITPDNMRLILHDSGEIVQFERLVSKVVLAIGQLEQFHVKITNLSGIVHNGSLGFAPVGGSTAILNSSALASTTYLRGAQALRFFQTHQIRCNLKRHPVCKQLREWRHGRGSIKVDPFTSISAIERYLLDRGIGLASNQVDDSSDNDDISDEEQDLSYSSAVSFSGRIELYIGEHRIPSDMSILQAIRQYALPYEEESQETIPSAIWLTAHTLYYKTADEGEAIYESATPNSGSISPASSNQTNASSVIRSVGSGSSSVGAVIESSNVSPSSSIATSSSSTRRYHYRHADVLTSVLSGATNSGSSFVRSIASGQKVSRTYNRAISTQSSTSSLSFTSKKEKYSANLTKDSRVFKDGILPKRTPLYLKYLFDSLDESINDPSLDCLVLLKTLYGLNTYWWALFEEEMPPPTHAAVLPTHVFHSPKLNSKVSRQLSDFLSVATQQIPKWTTDIVKAIPFAFPFVTRRNLLYCTSFGRDRALMHLLNEGTRDEHDGESTSRLIPRLERKKVSINRNNLLKDAQQVFSQMDNSKAMLEVGFEGEVGTGFGPTLEFYSTLSREIQKVSLKLWHGKAHKSVESENTDTDYVLSENGLYPTIYRPNSSRQMDARIKKFEFFGRLLAQSLLDSRMLDVPIAATFFKWLIGEEEEFGVEDLEILEPTIYRSLQKLSELDEEDFSDLETYFTFPGENAFEMIKDGKNIQLTKSNLKQFIELVCHWRLVEGVRAEMEAVRRGLQSVINLDSLRIFFPNEIEQLFCGCPEGDNEKIWSKSALQQALRPDHGFTYDSIQIVWLIQMLNTFPNEKRRKFLQFVTGSPRLPVGGFRSLNPPLTVVRKTASYGSPDNELPSAMTCYNYLKIPPYESYETFVERFEVALQFIYSFHLT